MGGFQSCCENSNDNAMNKDNDSVIEVNRKENEVINNL